MRKPGIARNNRISPEGLCRLEKQLQQKSSLSDMVLQQWLKRYGDQVRDLLTRYGYSIPED